MERFGKFCDYCNRQTLHERDDRGGTICGTCGTIAGPSAETIQAQKQRNLSDDVIESIAASKRIGQVQKEEEERKRMAGFFGFFAIGICAVLFIAIVGGLIWFFTQ